MGLRVSSRKREKSTEKKRLPEKAIFCISSEGPKEFLQGKKKRTEKKKMTKKG